MIVKCGKDVRLCNVGFENLTVVCIKPLTLVDASMFCEDELFNMTRAWDKENI